MGLATLFLYSYLYCTKKTVKKIEQKIKLFFENARDPLTSRDQRCIFSKKSSITFIYAQNNVHCNKKQNPVKAYFNLLWKVQISDCSTQVVLKRKGLFSFFAIFVTISRSFTFSRKLSNQLHSAKTTSNSVRFH